MDKNREAVISYALDKVDKDVRHAWDLLDSARNTIDGLKDFSGINLDHWYYVYHRLSDARWYTQEVRDIAPRIDLSNLIVCEKHGD